MARGTTHRAWRHDEGHGQQKGAKDDSAAIEGTTDDELIALRRLAEIEKRLTTESRRIARRPFDPGTEYRADVVSVAWEIAVECGGKWPPPTIMRIARRKVAQQFKYEHRAFDIGDSTEYEPASEFDVSDLFSEHLNPARIVRFCVDFCQWLAALNGWDYMVATRLRNGHTVSDIACALDAPARVIQRTRDDLFRHWMNYFSDE